MINADAKIVFLALEKGASTGAGLAVELNYFTPPPEGYKWPL